jgi:hypothetical protein
MRSKKGMGLSDLAPAAIAFVFIAVTIGVGATVLSNVQSGQVTSTNNCGLNSTGGTVGVAYSSCGAAYNSSAKGLDGLKTLADWMPTIALVIAAAIVIGVLAFFRS